MFVIVDDPQACVSAMLLFLITANNAFTHVVGI
jgi:hypothetical protein